MRSSEKMSLFYDMSLQCFSSYVYFSFRSIKYKLNKFCALTVCSRKPSNENIHKTAICDWIVSVIFLCFTKAKMRARFNLQLWPVFLFYYKISLLSCEIVKIILYTFFFASFISSGRRIWCMNRKSCETRMMWKAIILTCEEEIRSHFLMLSVFGTELLLNFVDNLP